LSEGLATVSMHMLRTGPAKRKPVVLWETRNTTVTGLEMFRKLLPPPL
jgi:translation elongation factor EF-Tu-like GTPase